MRILLDESLPRVLRARLPGHEVATVVGCGWSGIKNGELLALAATRFEVFLTADQNLEFQQNLSTLPLVMIEASRALAVTTGFAEGTVRGLSAAEISRYGRESGIAPT